MYDVAIVGAGVIGCGIAYTLSQYQLKVLLLEKENDVATGTTRANSAIIHAGYDPEPGTLMAKLNVEGAALMRELCRKLDVEYEERGSLVIGFDGEDEKNLRMLYERGLRNGVHGMRLLSRAEALAMEPQLSEEIRGALYAPEAGIIIPWDLALAFAEVAVRNGVTLRLNTAALGFERSGQNWLIRTPQERFESRYVINAAGVYSGSVHDQVAPPTFKITPTRGEYYLLDKADGPIVNHVIFQCPNANGKGVLVTPTVHGNTLIGPNAEKLNDSDDTACTGDGLAFVREEARRSVPNLPFATNIRNFAGLRANSDHDDFIIEFAAQGFLDCAAIKSPGLSAAPAIACYVAALLEKEGLRLEKRADWRDGRRLIRFKTLTPEEKADLIRREPAYGRVICRCETITEGEIIAALRREVPPVSIDGVKRRAGTGMGRCQGGFCGPRVLDILARETGLSPLEITQDLAGSVILTGETKEG